MTPETKKRLVLAGGSGFIGQALADDVASEAPSGGRSARGIAPALVQGWNSPS
jgi:hypothetical protein